MNCEKCPYKIECHYLPYNLTCEDVLTIMMKEHPDQRNEIFIMRKQNFIYEVK